MMLIAPIASQSILMCDVGGRMSFSKFSFFTPRKEAWPFLTGTFVLWKMPFLSVAELFRSFQICWRSTSGCATSGCASEPPPQDTSSATEMVTTRRPEAGGSCPSEEAPWPWSCASGHFPPPRSFEALAPASPAGERSSGVARSVGFPPPRGEGAARASASPLPLPPGLTPRSSVFGLRLRSRRPGPVPRRRRASGSSCSPAGLGGGNLWPRPTSSSISRKRRFSASRVTTFSWRRTTSCESGVRLAASTPASCSSRPCTALCRLAHASGCPSRGPSTWADV
mmetsp:Transcript_1075/g.2930  ORF Transcript_1075/g.2930 Transcript_1075/m.2930 type:complete len:282 (+) Transcript_1075:1715-2560(+)